MPVARKEQVELSPDEIMTRYYMTPGRFSPAEDDMAKRRGIGLMSGITQTPPVVAAAPAPAPLANDDMKTGASWNAADREAEKAYGPVMKRSDLPKKEKKEWKFDKVDPGFAESDYKEQPVERLAGNMSEGSYQGAGDRGQGYNLGDNGMSLTDKMQGLQIASAGATSAEVAESKDIATNEQKAAATVEQAKEDPESLTPAQKLAMIAMAIAPAIAGYAMYGEKGAYLGGIAGMKGVHETAVTIENQQSQERAQKSKEKIAADKLEKKSLTAKDNFVVGEDGIRYVVKKDETSPSGYSYYDSATGVKKEGSFRPQTPVVKDDWGQVISGPGKDASVQPASVPAPRGQKPEKLPQEPTVRQTENYQRNMQFKKVHGFDNVFFKANETLSDEEFLKPRPKESQEEYRARMSVKKEEEEFLRKSLAQDWGRSKKADDDLRAEARKYREMTYADKLKAAREKGNIDRRAAQQRANMKFKQKLQSISSAKTEKDLRGLWESEKKENETVDAGLSRLYMINNFKNLKNDPTQLAGLFNVYMKLVQGDESVVRDTDVKLVQMMNPWTDNVAGIAKKMIDEPGLSDRLIESMEKTSRLIIDAKVKKQLRKHSEYITDAEKLGANPALILPKGLRGAVNDYARKTFPTIKTLTESASMGDGSMFFVGDQLWFKEVLKNGKHNAYPVRQ